MANDPQTRERVRALVREVLQTAVSAEEADAALATKAEADAQPSAATPTRVAASAASLPVNVEQEFPVERDESAKKVITETDMRGLEAGARLRIAEDARLTPLAADVVRERGIELVRRAPRRGSQKTKLIAVGADHGGFLMKEELRSFLGELGHHVRDFGTYSTDAVDYPDFAHQVARAVANREADVGIIIDGAGVGSCITANKVPGVRAAACYSIDVARNSREHNDTNVLTLGSKNITNQEMREIVRAWLTTEITEERHRKRVDKMTAIERQYTR